MIRLCICEDKKEDVKELKKLIKAFGKQHLEYPIEMKVFMSPYDVLEYIQINGGFDIYLLDILMPGIDGINLARSIRERKETSEIIFLTISREYALDAFQVKASNYLVKPINASEFDAELLSSIQKAQPITRPSIVLKTKEGFTKINLHDVVLIEGYNHKQICIFSDGRTLETTYTLISLYDKLKNFPFFFMPHRSFIIHLDYITAMTTSHVTILGGRVIPISRNKYNDLKIALLEYASNKE
ncbi:LytR/AlgR family response regulator transcription factor [Amedibacillus sp. YH-ame6]